ncbi:hypothetical protein BUALT_Bualt08G0107000 [Buddleja alternifolia]|uniref:KIB1-4 beta-propeller domain-containing protein n=1 Tax=Buddleja alternifolia TaxID=168488 RepID=A0AAV6XDE7_9LAMI|nr:hypothetical protein BUALT_Bualt08G0107000 [Buddleja alternifolia]
MELNEANQDRHHPWLLISSHGAPHAKQFFYSISEDRFHATSIPELCNKCVLASAYGWLVLVDHDTDDCCLWNPVSMDKIELPELDCSSIYNRCVLSKPPTDPECHILFNSTTTLHRAFLQIGDDEFVILSSTNNVTEVCLSTVGSFQGKIYGIVSISNQFVTLNFVGKNLEIRPMIMEGGQPWEIPIMSPTWVALRKEYLIESPCGELLLVREMFSCSFLHEGLDFRVFRLDINQMKCVKLDNIGNQAIFLDRLTEEGVNGGVCYYSDGIKPNSIYYTATNSRNLHIYDLNDRSTTFLLPCPAARRSQSMNYWVEYETFQNLIK